MRGWLCTGAVALLAAGWWLSHGRADAATGAAPDTLARTAAPAAAAAARLRDATRPDDAADRTIAPPASAHAVTPPRPRREHERAPRALLAVDGSRRPIAGADVAVDVVFDSVGGSRGGERAARTDARGRAQLDLAVDEWVRAWARGHQLTAVQIPPDDGAAVTIVLATALRLEVSVLGVADFAGMHVRVELPRDYERGSFYQTRYEQTCGRAVDGTEARWVVDPATRRARWELCVPASGTAALDQVTATGELRVALMRFGRALDERTLRVTPSTGTARLQLTAPPTSARTFAGTVTDATGAPIAAARLRMSPFGGARIVDSPQPTRAFPVWAPTATTDAAGRFTLPRPTSGDERVVVTAPGHAAVAVTVAELDRRAGAVALRPARAVRLEVRDCNGAPLDGGWSTGGRHYAEPSVCLGHDVWRGTTADELPWFTFDELPPDFVTFRCAGERLRHDARVAEARLVTDMPVERMGIGK